MIGPHQGEGQDYSTVLFIENGVIMYKRRVRDEKARAISPEELVNLHDEVFCGPDSFLQDFGDHVQSIFDEYFGTDGFVI